MKKIILTIIILVLIWFLFINKKDAKAPSETITNSPSTIISTSVSPSDTTSPSPSISSTPSSTPSNTSTLDVSTWTSYTNDREGYTLKIHPWWWYKRYNNIDGALSIVAFDRNPLDERPYTDAMITIATYNTKDAPSNSSGIVKTNNNKTVIFTHSTLSEENIEIFNAMVTGFQFTQ